MTIMPLSGAVPPAATPSAGGTTAMPTNEIDRDTFLKLMVAQLRNQDPMNPQDSAEFLAQTAQFTSLEKLTAVAEQLLVMPHLTASHRRRGTRPGRPGWVSL